MTDWWSKKLAGEKPSVDRTSSPPVNVSLRFPESNTSQNLPASGVPQQGPSDALPADATLSDYLKSSATKGGQAARKETATCPECGDRYVFSRGASGGMAPAPRCYECGWNGMYSQAEQVNWS